MKDKTLKCPVCGSEDVKVTESKGYVPVVDSEEKVPFTEEVITCGKCRESVMGDQRWLEAAIRVSKALSVRAILTHLKERKNSFAYIERVLRLKAGTLTKWEAGEPVTDAEFALLKIIRAHTALLVWADDEGWKDQIITTIELNEADSKVFAAALTEPPMPSPALAALFEKYEPQDRALGELGYHKTTMNGTPVYVGPPWQVDVEDGRIVQTDRPFVPFDVRTGAEDCRTPPLTFEEFVKQELPEFKYKKVWIEDGQGHPIDPPEAHIVTEDDRHIVIPLSDVLLRSGKTRTASAAMAEQMIKSPSMGATVDTPSPCSLCESEKEPGKLIAEVHCPCCGAELRVEHGDDEGEIGVIGANNTKEAK